MDKALKKAHRMTGIARMERECRVTWFCDRLRLAYKVSGTQEAGRWAMLNRRTQELADRYCRQLPAELMARAKGEL